MPRLIVINGPPGFGKSTLARMYADEHPLTLVLDIDQIRASLGRWQDQLGPAGVAARVVAAAAAKAHLLAGHDVVVPQYLGRAAFLDELERLAAGAGAVFTEVVLMSSREEALRAFDARASSADPADARAHELSAHRTGEAGLIELYDRLAGLLRTRPAARAIPRIEGQPGRAYAGLLAALDGS